MEMLSDSLIVLIILGARFIVPLFIPLFPVPVMLLCMIIDGMDQTILQKNTQLPLTNYQSYDKALDIYYLSIAYLSTMRNWANTTGFKISRFLFYFRMVGSLLFEITHIRFLLLLFPNTFEYFFDFYEMVRLRWNPKRLPKKTLILAAAFIWIFIKLPQEWWIHVAQLDMTDFLRAHPTLLVTLIILCLVSPFILKFVLDRLPKAEYGLRFKVMPEIIERPVVSWRDGIVEKLILVSIISTIFGIILPNLQASPTEFIIGIAVVVLANSVLLGMIRIKKQVVFPTHVNILFAAGLNLVLGSIYVTLLGYTVDSFALVFFSLILGVIVGFFDSYWPYVVVRRRDVRV